MVLTLFNLFQAWQTVPVFMYSLSLPKSEPGEMQGQLRLSKENASALQFKKNIIIWN